MHGNERGDEEGVDMRKSGEKKEVEEPEAIAHLHTSLGKKTYVVQIYHIRKEGGGRGTQMAKSNISTPCSRFSSRHPLDIYTCLRLRKRGMRSEWHANREEKVFKSAF